MLKYIFALLCTWVLILCFIGMSVLNKTKKWKGGTLQIQLAKESFCTGRFAVFDLIQALTH